MSAKRNAQPRSASTWPSPESLGCPSNAEVDQITEGMPAAEREQFERVLRHLFFAKWRTCDLTPWQKLIERYRAGDLDRIELEVELGDGQLITQEAFIDNDGMLQGEGSWPRSAVAELSEALRRLKDFDPSRHISETVVSRVYASKRRQRRGERGAVYPIEEIRDRARVLRYWESPKGREQKDIRTTIIRDLKLIADRPGTSITSLDRHLQRILKA